MKAMGVLATVLLAAVGAGMVAAIVTSLPEIRRYMKIESM
jgi:hypothetical protein